MDHDEALTQLTALADGQLTAPLRAEVEEHTAGCADCAGVLATVRELQDLSADQRRILSDPHRTAEELARLAADDPTLAPDARLEIAAHARECGTCMLELHFARVCLQAPLSWGERLRARLGIPESLGLGRLAVTALIVLMAYPAYRGLTVPSGPTAADSGAVLAKGAGTRLVVLPAARRGTPEDIVVAAPRGTGLLPVAVEYDLAPDALGSSLRFTLRRGDRAVWTLDVAAEEVWNPDLATLSVLLPHDVLETGAHTLAVERPQDETSVALYPFRVEP